MGNTAFTLPMPPMRYIFWLMHRFRLRMNIELQPRGFNSGSIVECSSAVGGIAVDFSTRHMEAKYVADDLRLISGNAFHNAVHCVLPLTMPYRMSKYWDISGWLLS